MSPNYYASGVVTSDYVLSGDNFNNIPADAIGIYAIDNDNPLANRYSDTEWFLFDIVEKSNNTMRMKNRNPVAHSDANYLGAIVSSNRNTVYWVNNDRPLP